MTLECKLKRGENERVLNLHDPTSSGLDFHLRHMQ